MYIIKLLNNISITELTKSFNEAFSDYLIQLILTEKQMKQKLKSENIQLKHSFGAFENERLIGFILLATDCDNYPNVVYNAGTGVVPECRGRGIIEQVYNRAISYLSSINLYIHQLEVMVNNQKALKLYKKIGFEVSRELVCYKGRIEKASETNYQVTASHSIDFNEIYEFGNFKPTWQNDFPSLVRMNDKLIMYQVNHNKTVLGYCVLNQENRKIHQFAVKPGERKKGIAKSLFHKISELQIPNELFIINVDAQDIETNKFLLKMGFKPFINQFEMKMILSI
jgi:ribosomal protein S18 acetylase RimI-like enzyme